MSQTPSQPIIVRCSICNKTFDLRYGDAFLCGDECKNIFNVKDNKELSDDLLEMESEAYKPTMYKDIPLEAFFRKGQEKINLGVIVCLEFSFKKHYSIFEREMNAWIERNGRPLSMVTNARIRGNKAVYKFARDNSISFRRMDTIDSSRPVSKSMSSWLRFVKIKEIKKLAAECTHILVISNDHDMLCQHAANFAKDYGKKIDKITVDLKEKMPS
jgi:hypothetical protein